MTPVSILRTRLQATVASVFALALWWRIGGLWPAALTGVFAALALLAWFSPSRYAPVQHGLDALARWIAGGFSWLLLGLIYFGLFTPLHWFGALLGKDPLKLKTRDGGVSYLEPIPQPETDRFKRQF
jgi:hypothetical protein